MSRFLKKQHITNIYHFTLKIVVATPIIFKPHLQSFKVYSTKIYVFLCYESTTDIVF